MDFYKLKLDKFTGYNGFNLPIDFHPQLSKNEKAEVFFLFVASIQDVIQAINLVQNKQKHKDNRAFFVFKKGNKSFGREHVYNIIMKHRHFKRKAPMLASLNKEYSVFCFSLKV